MQEAKNCPFCEAIARVEHNPILGSDDPTGYAQVFCENRHSLDALHYTEEDALVEWNRRPIESALRAENARLREALAADIETMEYVHKNSGHLWEGLPPRIRRSKRALSSQAPEGEAHSKSEQRRIDIQQEAKVESGEADQLRDVLQLMVDAAMKKGDATQALSIARALLARKPAEERGPEVGDLVALVDCNTGEWWARRFEVYSGYDIQCIARGEVKNVVLMRRAEVEARVKGIEKEKS